MSHSDPNLKPQPKTLPRDPFTSDAEPLSKALPKMVADMNNAILGSNSFQDVYHALEKDGDKGCSVIIMNKERPYLNNSVRSIHEAGSEH